MFENSHKAAQETADRIKARPHSAMPQGEAVGDGFGGEGSGAAAARVRREKRDYLVVVDVQNDFVSGALGTEEAREAYGKVLEKVKSFNGQLAFTLDTHDEGYLDTLEGANLPVVHCVKGSWGWTLPEKLQETADRPGVMKYEKPTFGSIRLAQDRAAAFEKGALESVEIVGLCTDICIISNALSIKAFLPDVPVKVDASCCAGTTPEMHRAALDVMKSNQIEVCNE